MFVWSKTSFLLISSSSPQMESNCNHFHSFSCSTEVNKILSHKSDTHLINDNKHVRRRSAQKSDSFPNPIEESNSSNKSFKVDGVTTTSRQKMVLVLLAYGNLLVSACVSLQAPFFPREAELKGKT